MHTGKINKLLWDNISRFTHSPVCNTLPNTWTSQTANLQQARKSVRFESPKDDSNSVRMTSHNKNTDPSSLKLIMTKHKDKISAMTNARSLLRKFNDSQSKTDSLLLDTITTICKQKEPPMEPHGFQFFCTRKAAKHNHKLLAKFNCNFVEAIKAYPNSIISPGAELRKPSTLHQLLHHHQDWEKFHSILEHGVDYPFQDSILTDKQLQQEIPIMLDRGNHQSAKTEIRSKVLR